jgi:glycosyltransferase involved in cell wall biosynthesis
MAILATPIDTVPRQSRHHLAIAVADACWFTTENLFQELRHDRVATLLLKCLDYRNAWRRGARPTSWNRELEHRGPNLWQRELVLPPGWMKRYPRLGMRPIARAIGNWHAAHATKARRVLVMTYPHYLFLRDLVQPDSSVYFNVDDYTLYWPRRAREIAELELRMVRESDLTVCTSRLRAEELRASVPEAAGRIRHLPHGAPSAALGEAPQVVPAAPPADLARLPRPILGYVGSLEDRIDWELLERLSVAFPRASVVLIGRVPHTLGDASGWQAACQRCLARPNVHALGWRSQDSIAAYNRAFDVCLIPYRMDHLFNRACCPTKIMDCMATGRPIVASALPECLLYRDLFHVPGDADGFLAAVESILLAGSDDGRAHQRFDWAVANSCQRVADRLLSWLPAECDLQTI